VPESGSAAARELLVEAELASPATEQAGTGQATPTEVSAHHVVRLTAAILGGGLTAALVAWVLSQAAS